MIVFWLKKKTCIIAVFMLLISYLLFRLQTYKHETSVILTNTAASEAWEFIADFNNVKHLNPTIVDFTILSESGNYDNWQYTVQYLENLSHWPYLPNTAIAHFNIKGHPKQNVYYITSTHNTCLILEFFCLKSNSEFKFSNVPLTNNALGTEIVEYQCPTILSIFCKREVIYQREVIMKNLQKFFNRSS